MCECCEEINFWKNSIDNSQELKTSLVIQRKNKRSTLTLDMFSLNYCPACGQMINQDYM